MGPQRCVAVAAHDHVDAADGRSERLVDRVAKVAQEHDLVYTHALQSSHCGLSRSNMISEDDVGAGAGDDRGLLGGQAERLRSIGRRR